MYQPLLSSSEKLLSEWAILCRNLSVTPQAETDWWSIIVRRYREEWRSYHNLCHIQHLIQLFNQWRERIADLDTVRLAIFFHDIVYDPKAKDNELQSAVLLKKFAIDVKLPEDITKRAMEMIMATVTHCVGDDSEDLDICLFLDFDMAILGQESAIYDEYAANIRKEYSHYNEKDFAEGRTKVLQFILKSDNIYHSEDLRDVYEANARENIHREIQGLKSCD